MTNGCRDFVVQLFEWTSHTANHSIRLERKCSASINDSDFGKRLCDDNSSLLRFMYTTLGYLGPCLSKNKDRELLSMESAQTDYCWFECSFLRHYESMLILR